MVKSSPRRRTGQAVSRQRAGKALVGGEAKKSAYAKALEMPVPNGYARCPDCARPVRLNKDGVVQRHNGCRSGRTDTLAPGEFVCVCREDFQTARSLKHHQSLCRIYRDIMTFG